MLMGKVGCWIPVVLWRSNVCGAGCCGLATPNATLPPRQCACPVGRELTAVEGRRLEHWWSLCNNTGPGGVAIPLGLGNPKAGWMMELGLCLVADLLVLKADSLLRLGKPPNMTWKVVKSMSDGSCQLLRHS